VYDEQREDEKLKLLRILAGVLAGLILLVLVGPFLVPVRPLQGLAPPEDLADPDSEFVEVDGLKFQYKRKGSGRPAMILLHGFSASTFSWRSVMEPLSKLGTVVAYDRPASGLTERPLTGHPRMEGGPAWTGTNPYSAAAQAEQLVELMDKLGIDKAVLIGNSAGGTVAMNTALTYPERVQGLVLVDAAIYTGGGAPAWIKPLLSTPQLQRIGPLSARFLASSGGRLIGMAWHDPSKVTPDVLEGYRKPTQAQDWDKALWELTKASSELSLGARVSEVTQPALVITGDDDRIVPTKDSIRLAAELPNAKLVVIPECGHTPQEECPEPWLNAVTEFVRGL
jgi:pimeloyl-ACP methyl ester carboxylesterase